MAGRPKKFFLGKSYDLDQSEMLNDEVFYDPDDLTTHGVITGMTGSGKTGLGVIMLEEAALRGIPAIVIDPKGDLTNLLLHFPDLLPNDFQPWVNRDAARRDGISVEEASQKAASLWKNGLASYGIGKPELQALSDSAEFAVYTPGSDAGLPVSILASLNAPPIPWEGNKEVLRDEIASTVIALLGLIGFKDIDPVRSKEHILLSNIFEEAWRQGKDLDMGSLISHVQSPPFEKLGVLSLEQFYPEKDRFNLAMMLNNFLAAPAFQTWLEGQALDVGQILFTPEGKPRHSVFYLAHLNDQERMFFVTLLYTAIESWMRGQKGSSSLRAMVYFDEVAGYLPPVANPASKSIILRMLKQARAFGVGLILATQNPVDLDYKALSNAGTWMVGKLQTEQDKARLLDGLEGAAPGVDRKAFDRMISLIDKRVFLLHNVHEDAAQIFHTRWAMNYLPGPITQAQIPELNALVGAQVLGEGKAKKAQTKSASAQDLPGKDVTPSVPGAVNVHYYPAKLLFSEALERAGGVFDDESDSPQMVYKPTLAGQARVAFLAKKHNISHEAVFTVRIDEMKRKGLVRWENFLVEPVDLDVLSSEPRTNARYESLDNLTIEDSKYVSDLKSDFEDWVYRTQTMKVKVNEALDLVAGPDVSEAEFKQMCAAVVEKKMSEEIENVKATYEKKLDDLEEDMRDEMLDLEEEKQDLNHRRMEEVGKGVENIMGLFTGRRRSISTSLTKRRMTSKAKADVAAAEQEIKKIEEEMKRMEKALEAELEEVKVRWEKAPEQVIEEPVSPYKKNIFIELFGLVWVPYYAYQQDSTWKMAPAFEWDVD
jgi:hypothetical protein